MQLLTTSLLTTTQVSAALGLQPSTLKKWRVLGIGPKFVRVGKREIRYRQSDVKAFISHSNAEAAQ